MAATQKVSWSVGAEVVLAVEERARLERRSVSAMVSLLLERALDEGEPRVGDEVVLSPAAVEAAGSVPVRAGASSSSSVCERALYHRKGEFCKACGRLQ